MNADESKEQYTSEVNGQNYIYVENNAKKSLTKISIWILIQKKGLLNNTYLLIG